MGLAAGRLSSTPPAEKRQTPRAKPLPSEPHIDEERFSVEYLTPEEYEEVHRMQVDVFTEHNVEARCAKISKTTWDGFSRLLNHGWEKVGLTQIVRDRSSNDVVAFLFCKEKGNEGEPLQIDFKELCEDSPGLRRIVEHGGYFCGKAHHPPRLGRALAIETGGTKSGYEGLGLATFLRHRLLRLAKQHGFHRLTVETSSMGTRHIYRDKLGFGVLAESRYYDWQAPDGTHPFRDEYKMPDDFLFTCQEKILKPEPDVPAAQQLHVTGAGCEEVNGVYLRLPGSRGTLGSTSDAWVHATRPDTYIANQDGESLGHPEWGKKWFLCGRRGWCYWKMTDDDGPPEGPWEMIPESVAETFKLGEPGDSPPPEVTLRVQGMGE